MEHEHKEGEVHHHHSGANSQNQIAGAIIIAGLIIAGAILLKGTNTPNAGSLNNGQVETGSPSKVTSADRTLGDPNAKVTLIVYEDFQCPFCDKFFKESEKPIIDTYVKSGEVLFVYRDFAFLGAESIQAAEAARCAGDQGKFWEYHDYLFNHQDGENRGGFADAKLKTFASTLGLNQSSFDQCLDSNKYEKAVADSAVEGRNAGVSGTPKGFIMKGGKVISTINGAQPYPSVKQMIDAALK
jgi:protein-disulfide isomerase